jgi:uncharacterized membrane protein
MNTHHPIAVSTDKSSAMKSLLAAVRRALKDPVVQAGFMLGAGFGGLADGIVLHSILGWHHMICYSMDCQPTSVAQLQLENTQDGYFLLLVWLMVLTGTAMLFRAVRAAGPAANGRILLGAILSGCGLFNFLEGLINHQILGLHHVVPGSPHQFLFDMLYLLNGLLFFKVGGWLILSSRAAHSLSATDPGNRNE